jgi:NADH dehydrogenase
VHLSGLGADPASSSAYVAARGHGDVEVRAACPAATILRPSVVFGPGDHALTMIAVAARLMPALPLFGGGTAKVQPVYVGDVADAALACLEDTAATPVPVFELGGPTVYTYRQLHEAVLAAIGRKRRLIKAPMALGRIMAFFAGLLPNPPLTRDALVLMATDNVVAPGAKDLASLGIRPTALELILPTYMDQYRRGGRWRNTRFA